MPNQHRLTPMSAPDEDFAKKMATEADALPAPQSRREKELEATRKLIAQAEDLLGAVDESYFMMDKTPREYPKFNRNEVVFGPVLGVGGFGIVFEVGKFALRVPEEVDIQLLDQETSKQEASSETSENRSNMNPEEVKDESGYQDATIRPNGTVASDQSHTTAATSTGAHADDMDHSQMRGLKMLSFISDDEIHYDLSSARRHMYENARRSRDARYAVKRLHRDLNDFERTRGMIDLAIEAKFMSTLWHPNIVKMRGMSSGPMLSPDFFIVMDRLYVTLKERMKVWKDIENKGRGVLGFGRDRTEMDRLMLERLVIANDMASAYWYLHENKIVYRDIKQENIGFDFRGDVKIFDFGLCKGLSPSLRNKEGHGYLLTPRTGSVPYMAPEIVECLPYDCQCDVYSFSILVWEMLSLKTAFKGYSRRDYLERVVKRRERPVIFRQWPAMTRSMIREAWDNDPVRRPSMKRVAALIRGDLNEMTSGSKAGDKK